MAYLGQAPNKSVTTPTSQSFNGDGSTTAFTLNRGVNYSEELEVFVDNIQQEPGTGKSYTASGTTLTFDEAPATGTGNIYVIYRGQAQVGVRLEHDANASISATDGTFSGDVSAVDGTFSGGVSVTGVHSSESYPLHVSRSTGNVSALLESTGSTASRLYFKNTGMTNEGDTQIWSQNNELAFNTSATEKMRIGSNVQIKNQGTNNLNIVSSGGAGYTQGDIRIIGSTADGPSGRGQGVYLFNEGNDRTWYMGTLYNSGTSFGIGTTTGANVEPAAADRGRAQITVKTNGKVHLGPEFNNPNTAGTKIFGMRAPNILSWEDNFSTTQASTIPSSFTNWYNVRFDKLSATNKWYHGYTPFGGEGVVWSGTADTSETGAQGGWGTNGINIDRNYDYVLINFVQRVSSATSGTYYFGTSGGVVRAGGSNNGIGDSNPYFTVLGISNLVKDEWYVDYRTIRSANNTSTAVVKNNGLYKMRDGTRAAGNATANSNAYRFSSTQTTCNHRTYLYYATANGGSSLRWYQPMMFKCDGTEPTLSEIFKLYEVSS